MEKPETIENRWDILYRDYPEVYDEFASMPYSKTWVGVISKMFKLENMTVADIGSGSGKSTFELAEYARQVIGVEPEDSMMDLAIKSAKDITLPNVSFKKGWAHAIPLKDDSVDMTVTITGAFFHDPDYIKKFHNEACRITKTGGYVVVGGIAPRWYGGELASVILGKERKTNPDTDGVADTILTELGFEHKHYYSITDYQTVDKAIKTYGFIFGKKAIEYLKKHQKTTIKWKFRIYYKNVS